MRKFEVMLRIRAWIVAMLVVFFAGTATVASEPVVEVTGVQADSDTDAQPAVDVVSDAGLERSTAERLQAEFGIPSATLESMTTLEGLREQARVDSATLQASQVSITQELEGIERLQRSLWRQIGHDGLPETAQQVILQELARSYTEAASLRGQQASAESALESRALMVGLLDAQIQHLAGRAGVDSEGQRRVERAELSEREALQTLEDARERETREQNQQVRLILARERELAEELVETTREDTEQLRRLVEERRTKMEAFADQQVILADRVASLPEIVSDEFARETVDPLFDELLVLRKEARDARRTTRRAYEKARREKVEAEANLAEATRQLEQTRARSAVLGDTELARRQVALEELREKRAQAGLERLTNRVDAKEQALKLEAERAAFFHELVERVLPKVSGARRSRFFSPLRDENWLSGFHGLVAAGDVVVTQGKERIEQAVKLPERLLSITLWSWALGLMFRLLLFPLSLYLGREYGPRLVRKLMDTLLAKSFFRQRASGTIKFAEILRAVMLPLLMYFSLGVAIDYVTLLLPEFWVARAVIDVMIFYVVTMTVLKVMVLPRGYRERSARSVAPDLSALSSAGNAVGNVDVVRLEISRAQKLVLSVRFVLIFGLLAKYVPAAVIALMGHSVIWWTIHQIFMYGFFAVFYLVLNSWKDDIAGIFDRLASERLPRAVSLVNNHKDRPYGVLLIAVASVYVVVFEAVRIVRVWLEDTSWSRQASNFLFRKKIELQRREREEEVAAFELSSIPPEYQTYFQDFPLTQEMYRVERRGPLDAANAVFTRWLTTGKRGSVVLMGESGIGKTTLLHQLAGQWREDTDYPVVSLQLCDKLKTTEDVYAFFETLFGLSCRPTTREELVGLLRKCSPRVLLIDDCHHLFMRQIGGFDAVNLFLDVVNRLDSRHFWVLSFNNFAWSYLNRVRVRQHLLGAVIRVEPWSEAEIQQLIRRRDVLSNLTLNFNDLMVAHENADQQYEVVKTSNGYFRLLHEYCHGNPRVALMFWLRSLKYDARRNHLHVSLFQRPSQTVLTNVSNDHLFALAAIVQHGCLDAHEIAAVTHIEKDLGEMVVDYLHDSEIVRIEPWTGRAALSGLYFRAVLRQLADANYLYE